MIETDYLIVGAGAMGLAFADTILNETDSTVLLVDRYGRPGGHWNHAYPFVRLHQPSSFYGVNSLPLGSGAIDSAGLNAGLHELASGAEVLAYFDRVMNQVLLPTGRVDYHPLCEYIGAGRFNSLATGATHQVHVNKRVVDATYMNVTVPATKPPEYDVADGAMCVPINELAHLREHPEHFVVIGAGKTGIDACLFLLGIGVDPDMITWIRPRDSWLLNRSTVQPDAESFVDTVGGFALQMEAAANADSIDDMFDRLEEAGQILRIDPEVKPTSYRCATVTDLEIEQLRRIEDVVRLGRVYEIHLEAIDLRDGCIPTTPQTLHVDCTADGLEHRDAVPVFVRHTITLQTVRSCQQVFSAAFIAHLEALQLDDTRRNELSIPVPHPSSALDLLRTMLANSVNSALWNGEPGLHEWLSEARLDANSTAAAAGADSPEAGPILERIMANLEPARANLERLIAGSQ